MEYLDWKVNIPFTQILSNHGLVQTISAVQELGNIKRHSTGNETIFNEELDTLGQ